MKTPRNSLITLEQFLAHVKNRKEHGGYPGVGILPIGTENQTIRKNATNWEATSIFETHTDGAYVKASSDDTLLKLRDINDVYSAYHYKYDTDQAYVIKNEVDIDFSTIVLLSHFNDAAFPDTSSYAHSPTIDTASLNTTIYKWTSSAEFHNNSSGVAPLSYAKQNGEFRLRTNDWTIDMWLCFKVGLGSHEHIITYGPGSPGLGLMWGIEFATSNIYFTSNSGKFHCAWTPALNTLYHVRFCRNGSDAYIFINGSSQSVTIDSALGDIATNATKLDIGAGWHDLVGYTYYGFIGIIEELYINNGVCLSITDFDPPVSEYPDPSMAGDNEIIRAKKSTDIYTQDLYIGSEGMRIIFLGEVLGSGGGSVTLKHSNLISLGWADSGHTVPVPLAYGGTAKALTASNGGIVYTDADSMEILSGTATAQKLLMSQSNVAPIWSTPTYPNTATSGCLLRGNGTNIALSTFTIPDTCASGDIPYASGINTLAFGTTLPTHTVTTQLTTLKIEGGVASGGNLTLSTTAHATKGKIILGTASAYDEVNDRFGIGTTSPVQMVEFVKNQNNLSFFVIGNSTAGNAARSGITLTEDNGSFTKQMYMTFNNTSYSAGAGNELLSGRRGVIGCNGSQNGITILTADNTPIIFGINGFATANEVARFTTAGLTIYSALKTIYRDTSIHIASLDDGHLDLTADVSIDVNGLILSQNIQPTADNTYYLGKNSISTPLAWKGVIVKDTTNGNYYRIEVTNGTVTPTQIT